MSYLFQVHGLFDNSDDIHLEFLIEQRAKPSTKPDWLTASSCPNLLLRSRITSRPGLHPPPALLRSAWAFQKRSDIALVKGSP